jgi:glycosyl transferase family 25
MILRGIDKIYCVNLERRPDRRKEAIQEFSKFNLPFDFFKAVDGHLLNVRGKITPGHIGCIMSHFNLYKKLLNEPGEVFLITEDDVVFDNECVEKYNLWIEQVPDDWVLLYLGGSHNSSTINMIANNVHQLSNTYTTHAYIVKKLHLSVLIEEFNSINVFDLQVDVHLSNVQKKYPCYGFIPHLAWQREGFSDIEMGYRNYGFLKK